MLEDDFTYVIRKAFKGLSLAPTEAARLAGLPENEVLSFSRGNFSAATARKLGPILGLNPEALASHPHFQPRPLTIPHIHRVDLPFGEDRVNAWLVQASGVAILFDTGYDSHSCAAALDAMGIGKIDGVFITHQHSDHTGGISSFLKKNIPVYDSNIRSAICMNPGDAMECGSVTVRACDLQGHAMRALGFLVHGLEVPVLVTGDALFAGSIGGCATPEQYQQALQSLKTTLSPLPNSTILLPGHGPSTTLGEERVSNPFLFCRV